MKRPRQLVVDQLLERLERLGSGEVAAVDEEGRGPVGADLLPLGEIGLDAGGVPAGGEALVEAGGVETEGGGLRLEGIDAQIPLIGEHRVVHLPELPFLLGAEGGLGGLQRVGVHRQRQVTEDDPDLLAVGRADLVEGGVHPGAERALELGELDDRHRGVGGALRRAVGADPHAMRLEEDPHLVLLAQRRKEVGAGLAATLGGEELLDLRRDRLLGAAAEAALVRLVPGVHVGVGDGLDLGGDLGGHERLFRHAPGERFGLEELLLDQVPEALLEQVAALLVELGKLCGDALLELGHRDRLAVDLGDGLGGGGSRLRGGLLLARAGRHREAGEQEQGESDGGAGEWRVAGAGRSRHRVGSPRWVTVPEGSEYLRA